EGVEEEEEDRRAGKLVVEHVALDDLNGCDRLGGWVGGVGHGPVADVVACDGGQGGVELDANDVVEAEFAGEEQAAAFAGADVDKGVGGDGVGRDSLAPV